jgi:hypothetical protein
MEEHGASRAAFTQTVRAHGSYGTVHRLTVASVLAVPKRFDELRTSGGTNSQSMYIDGEYRKIIEQIEYTQIHEMVSVGDLDHVQKAAITSLDCTDSDMKRVEDIVVFGSRSTIRRRCWSIL